jgi:transcriptional regulator with XRE-family HTH domain
MAKATRTKVTRKQRRKLASPDALAFARRLREGREAARLTQLDLANAVGCHPQMINRYECAECMPKSSLRVVHMAQAIGRSVEWLTTGRGPKAAA